MRLFFAQENHSTSFGNFQYILFSVAQKYHIIHFLNLLFRKSQYPHYSTLSVMQLFQLYLNPNSFLQSSISFIETPITSSICSGVLPCLRELAITSFFCPTFCYIFFHQFTHMSKISLRHTQIIISHSIRIICSYISISLGPIFLLS